MFSKFEENWCLLPFDIAYNPQLPPIIRRNLLLHVHIKATITLKKETARSKEIPTVFHNATRCQNPAFYHLVSTRCEEPDICRIRIDAIVCLSLVLLFVRPLFPLSIMDINIVDTILHNLLQTSWNWKRVHISALWILVFINIEMARHMSVTWQQL